jgi:nucleotide-binding universal stress UspA family protein
MEVQACPDMMSPQGIAAGDHRGHKEENMRVLLAIDGSKFTEATTRSVISLLRAQDSEALVLQIVEPLVYSTPPQMAPGYAPEMAARLQSQIKEAKESVSRTAEVLRTRGFKAESRVIEAETRTGILDAAEEWKADLIVLGSHGEKGLRKFFLGSISESVARHAPCSVLIVRMPAAEEPHS